MEQNDTLLLPEALLERLADADHVLVFTGAGMSAESGIATFRDAQTGLWAKFRPEDLATPQAFSAQPACRLLPAGFRFRGHDFNHASIENSGSGL